MNSNLLDMSSQYPSPYNGHKLPLNPLGEIPPYYNQQMPPKRRYDTRDLKYEFDVMGRLYYDPQPPIEFVRKPLGPYGHFRIVYDPTWIWMLNDDQMGPAGGQY